MDGSVKESDNTQKRTALEDLNKEDLVKKCKNFLVIAQRAKQAKDEATEEIKRLKEQLNALQLKYEKVDSKESNGELEWKDKEKQLESKISTMEEMLSNLTDQKLQYTMEADSLKKQNLSLEKQLKQFKIDEAKLKESSVILQAQIDELETAAESYKRQNHRLSDENEALLQQMETLESEMRMKEAGSNYNQVKELEVEIQVLRDEVDCLKQEDSRKKTQMKQLFENFSKEKSELESKLEEEQKKKKNKDVQNLTEELKTLTFENEKMLIDIKSVKENNYELQRLVEMISSERDTFNHQCKKLNEQRNLEKNKLELLESEKKSVMNTNVCLEEEKCQLNQLLENCHKKIGLIIDENNLLKAEKEGLNEKLLSLLNEREKLNCEFDTAECQLLNMLHQLVSILQQNKVSDAVTNECNTFPDKQSSSLQNLISLLNEKLALVLVNVNTVYSSDKVECYRLRETEKDLKLNEECSVTESGKADVNLQARNYFTKLYTEISLLDSVISNLETQSEFLHSENLELKKTIDLMKKSDLNSMSVLDENICMKTSCVCCSKITQLTMELESCKNNSKLMNVEVENIKMNCDYLDNCVHCNDIEEELRKELNHCRQCLSQKNIELNLLQEELAFVLGKQKEFGEFQRKKLGVICKETLHSNRSVEGKELEIDELKQEILKLQEQKCNSELEINRLEAEKQVSNAEIENMSCVTKNLENKLANLDTNVKIMQQDILASKETISDLENSKSKLFSEKVNVEKELDELKQELLIKSCSVEEQSAGKNILKEKLSEYINSETDMNIIVERLKRETEELRQQLTDKCLIVDKYNNELQTLKEINGSENKELQNYICKLEKEIDENSKKDLEVQLLKADVIKLTSEIRELNAELEIKSKLILEKEAEIQTLTKKLNSTNSSLEIIKSDLEDKILKFENETQNLRFLFDEKNIELNLAKDEIRNIRQNSVLIPREKFVEISDLQSAFKAKDSELETLRTTLLKAESNLAQTLVKLSENEAEYLNLQNFSETLKEKISELNVNLEEKACELSKLQVCLDEKCSEISNISKTSHDTITEIEELREELKQCQSDRTRAENNLKSQLLESQDSYKVCVEKLNSFEIQKEQFQNDFKVLENSYTEKTRQLENMSEELHILQSRCHDFKEKLKVSNHQYDEIKSEMDSLKKEYKVSHEKNQKVEEELRIARTCYDDKVKELENLNSELVNVENASAEAFGRLTAMTVELDSVKEVSMTSTRKLNELNEELKVMTCDLKIKEAALQEKSQELEESKKTNEFLNLKTENTKTGLDTIMLRISELKDIRSKLSEDIQSLKTSVLNSLQQDTWLQIQMIIESFVQAEIAIIKKENAELLGEMNEMNQVLKQRGETISKLKEMNAEQEQQLKESNNKINVIQEDLKSKLSELESKTKSLCNLEMTVVKLKESHQEDMLVKEETIKGLEKEVAKFKECQHELETKTSALEAREESIHNLEAELGKQTKKLQELETKNKIEKLEETVREERKENTEIEVTDNQKVKIKELQDEVSSLKTRIQQLEREAEEMRKENGDAPSEIMSSSTISKAEESARLKDLEETFEERYTKLRIVAVRLKKKVSELTAQQTQLETDKKKLTADKSELQAKVTQLSAHAKNLQTMQQEYDRLQDEFESQKTEVKQLTKNLEAAVNESASVKVQLQECQQEKDIKVRELEVYSKDKQSLNAVVKDLMSQVQTLKKEKDADNTAKKEKEKEMKRLEEEMKIMEKRLIDEVDQHKNTQDQLEIRKQECKKRSVLSLEMEDYERSVAELTQQLTAEKSKVKELESHLETQWDISRGLQEQISLLEQRILSEEARSKEVKDQLNISRTKLSELEAHAQDREVLVTDLTFRIEHHREESENLVLQLSEVAAEKQRLIESGRNQQDELTRQVHVLEEYVSRLKENLAERETELGDLRAEFVNYKVRAQSVLRQKARPEEGTSTFSREDCMEELSQLKQTADILRTKLEDASAKLQTLTVENSAVQEDRTRVLQRCQELVDTVQDLRSQNSQLQTQLEEMATEHREAIRSHKLQAETLKQCYKQQLEELEDRLQKETTLLKKQLEETDKQMRGLEPQSSALGEPSSMQLPHAKGANVTLNSPNNTHWNNGGTGFVPVSASGMNQRESENRLEISMLEREEGEGSESVDSISPHLTASQDHRTELVPLDKLLSSPSEDDINVPSTAGGSPSMEVGQTKEQLVMSECRIRHLTGLLSEAERDLAKLTQQNQVLKEEIRRQQRSVEREQHAQNFEYLKNVVLKFVTLQGGDERSRLVPVLNTILKLSPEETNQLNIVAKGGPELQVGGKGWSSYLSLWSGTQ